MAMSFLNWEYCLFRVICVEFWKELTMQDLESILTKINQRKSELDILRQSLDNATIKEALKVEFLYESNRIEGNTLTLRETQLVINEGMTISGKSMREHLEAITACWGIKGYNSSI